MESITKNQQSIVEWKTSFDTANNLINHEFSDRIQVVTDVRTGIVKVIKDGEIISKSDSRTIVEYEIFLMSIAKSIHELNAFKDDRS